MPCLFCPPAGSAEIVTRSRLSANDRNSAAAFAAPYDSRREYRLRMACKRMPCQISCFPLVAIAGRLNCITVDPFVHYPLALRVVTQRQRACGRSASPFCRRFFCFCIVGLYRCRTDGPFSFTLKQKNCSSSAHSPPRSDERRQIGRRRRKHLRSGIAQLLFAAVSVQHPDAG